jgi:xanthine/uracil permease
MAIAGLVLGIAALVLCWIPFFGYVPAVLGIVFAAIGLKAANRGRPGKGMAIAGLTCAIIAAIATTAISVYVVTHVGSCASRYDPGTSDFDNCVSDR